MPPKSRSIKPSASLSTTMAKQDKDIKIIIKDVKELLLSGGMDKEQTGQQLTKMIHDVHEKREELLQATLTHLVEKGGMNPDDAMEVIKMSLAVKKKMSLELDFSTIINHSFLIYPNHAIEYTDRMKEINESIRALRNAMIEIREKLYEILADEIAVAVMPFKVPVREYIIFGKRYYLKGSMQGFSMEDIYYLVTDLECQVSRDVRETLNLRLIYSSDLFGRKCDESVGTNKELVSMLAYNDMAHFLYTYVARNIPFSKLIINRGKGVYIATVVKEMEIILSRINWIEFLTRGHIVDCVNEFSLQYSPSTPWIDFVRINSLD